MSDTNTVDVPNRVRYRVIGMDFPSCAAKIETAVRSAGVDDVKVSIASQIMTVRSEYPAAVLAAVERKVSTIGYRIDRLDVPGAATASEANNRAAAKSHITPEYRHALWIVIGLNVGYGIIEMFGGFLAGSQALNNTGRRLILQMPQSSAAQVC